MSLSPKSTKYVCLTAIRCATMLVSSCTSHSTHYTQCTREITNINHVNCIYANAPASPFANNRKSPFSFFARLASSLHPQPALIQTTYRIEITSHTRAATYCANCFALRRVNDQLRANNPPPPHSLRCSDSDAHIVASIKFHFDRIIKTSATRTIRIKI